MVKCRWCKSENLRVLWDLLDAPYGDLFRDVKQNAQMESKHPFRVAACESCNLLQLKDATDVSVQYDNYLYQTNITVGLNEYYARIAEKVLASRTDFSTQRILDIGSNDGSFLNFFSCRGFEVLGIEPANSPAAAAKNRGINTINEYFSFELSKRIKEQYPDGFDLISVNYTLANVPDVNNFLRGVENLLSKTGTFSIISGYHPDQFSVGMFDYIGHDHLMYFSLKNFIQMFSELGLDIFEATRSEYKGGSLHVVGGKRNLTKKRIALGYILQREDWSWPSNLVGIQSLKYRTQKAKEGSLRILTETNENWLGIGASISTSYLINEFEMAKKISYLVDDDEIKQGKYSPLYALEVIPFNHERVKREGNAIILAWQHSNVLINRLKASDFKGKVLIPLPEPHLLIIE